MKTHARLVGVLLWLVAGTAMAQASTHRIYVDLDANPATGCSVTTAAGIISGVELRLDAQVGGTPPQVQSVARARCTGSSFAAAQPQSAGYPVGVDIGFGGADVVEFSTPLAGLGNGGPATVHFVSANAGGADMATATITLPAGAAPLPPAPVPTVGGLALLMLMGGMVWVMRRHPGLGANLAVVVVLVSGLAWAANFVDDGQVDDWAGSSPVVLDPPGDSSNGDADTDIVAGWAATEAGRLFVRVDILDLAAPPNTAPTLADANFSIDENSVAGAVVGQVTGTDVDAGQTLSYAITAGNTGNAFAMNAATGTITVANPAALDFKVTPVFTLSVTATDDGVPPLSAGATVTISLGDVNEAPTLADASFAVDENSAAGTVVGQVIGTDVDAGQTLSYAITAGNAGNAFAINVATGTITVANPAALDFEVTPVFTLSVSATDDGTPPLSGSATVTITLNDINEAPTLNDVSFSVDENSAAGTVVGQVTGTDVDAGQTLSYAITAGNTGNAFAMNPVTGTITVANPAALDFKVTPVFTLSVTATDDGVPPLSAGATVTISLSDINEAPTLADASFAVDENSAAGTVVGQVIGTDVDAGQTLSYAITAGNTGNAFAMSPSTGDITVANPAALDFESTPVFTLSVTATDDGTPPLSGSATVTITLNDVNEAPTLADASFSVDENSAASTVVGQVAGTDVDAGQTLSYAITAGNTGNAFAMNAATGTITVANPAALDFEATPMFTLSVTATDDGTPPLSDSATVTITLNDVNEAPTLDDTSRTVLQDSALGTLVGAPLLATDPDTAAPNNTLSYALTAGNTNNAFALDAGTGQLSVATSSEMVENASFLLTVTVTDGGGMSDTAAVTVTVTDINDAPSFVPGPPQTVLEDAGAQAVAWATAIDDNDPAVQVLTFVVTSDSPALFAVQPAIDADTGTLSYTPADDAHGVATVTVVLHDDGGTDNGGIDQSAPYPFTITITPVNDPPSFVAGADQTAAEDAPEQVVTNWATAISPGPANESGQTVSFVVDTDNPALFTTLSIAANGTLTYQPAPDAHGVANVSVHALDNGGTSNGGIDQSPTQSFAITITAVDDPPVAVDDAVTVSSGSGATSIDVLANDTDIDGGPMLIESVTQPDNGTVAINVGEDAVSYQPDAGYCNTRPSITPDTFDYTLNGGSSATVSVTVTCPASYVVGSLPRGVTAADINGDGRADLAVPNRNSNSVSRLLSSGAPGQFAPAVNHGVGTNPTAIAAADLNGDGLIDLVTANSNSANVSVLLASDALGNFHPAVNYSVSGSPNGIAVADFNGDGRPDLAVASFGSGGLFVLYGQGGAGTFGPPQNLAAGMDVYGVAVGDLNGDGLMDVVGANWTSAVVSVVLATGPGTFAPRVTYAVGSTPRAVGIADLNGDGHLDIVNARDGGLMVLLGTGQDGLFQAAMTVPDSGGPNAVITADLDGDGAADVATTQLGAGRMDVFFTPLF